MNLPAVAASSPPVVYVVAVDETPSAEHVLDLACDLGAKLGGSAELHIVHVVLDPPADAAMQMIAIPAPQDYFTTGRALLERLAARAATRFPGRVSGHLAKSRPWQEIVQIASDLEADLVIVGTAGRTGLSRLALGSVAEQVVRHAGCPVLVVRPKERHADREAGNQHEVHIEPACPSCLSVRAASGRSTLWCERHATHHPGGRLHYEVPPTFGLGSMNFRPDAEAR
ncbi:MAG: Universal stress protein UspA [Labilithrix sp.]|nr:Universal stress protein UspA [Labilithrix sp.]